MVMATLSLTWEALECSTQLRITYVHFNAALRVHPQGTRRFRDNTPVAGRTLWDGANPESADLLNVNFRPGRFGRFEWEKEGEA